MAAADMQAAMNEHAATEMPADMPCCPKQAQAPMPDCAKDCLFMAMCVAQFACDAMRGSGLVVPLGLAGLFIPGSDTNMAGLNYGPPPRPPKTEPAVPAPDEVPDGAACVTRAGGGHVALSRAVPLGFGRP